VAKEDDRRDGAELRNVEAVDAEALEEDDKLRDTPHTHY